MAPPPPPLAAAVVAGGLSPASVLTAARDSLVGKLRVTILLLSKASKTIFAFSMPVPQRVVVQSLAESPPCAVAVPVGKVVTLANKVP